MAIRKLVLPVETPQIEINGIVFDLKMSDVDIFARAQELFKKYQKYNEKSMKTIPVDEVLENCKESAGFVDEILGEGATLKISGGKPVNFSMLMKWISLIGKDAASHFAELVESEQA